MLEEESERANLEVDLPVFRSLFERARDALFVQDLASGTIVEVNCAACDLFGKTREELIGQRRVDLFPPESANIYEAAVSDQVNRYNAIPLPVRLQRADGSMVCGEMSAVVVDACNVVVLQVVFRGITERLRETEERVRLAERTREQQKLEAVAVLAGGVAHEMNNVLAGILTTATLLLRSLPPGPTQTDSEAIVQAVRRGRSLTHNILGFAQRGMYRREVVPIGRLLTEVTALCRRSFSDDVVLQTSFGTTRAVRGDPEQLTEAVMNACLNAVEAMGGKGTLTLASADVDLGPTDLEGLSDASPGPFVRIVVRDTGEGMDAETLRRAFDPFFTTKESGVSGGLGLSMVYGVVQHHHGHVRLESRPGVGTVLTMDLPAALESVRVPPVRAVPSPALSRSGPVLVVDDDDWVRFSSRRLLEAMGRTVLEARDGVEAVESYRKHLGTLAFVLLDLRMPRMDGAEALREILQIDPNARVIICTGFEREYVSQDLFAVGSVGFLRKPFEASELLLQMDEVWPEEAAPAEAEAEAEEGVE